MLKPNGKYVIDRREGTLWLLEFEDGKMYEFDTLPQGANEGDSIIKDGEKLILVPFSEEQRQQIKSRMNSLFKKRR